MDLGLKDKVALLTASSQGIGRAVAEELAAEGARLLLSARSPGPLEETAAHLRAGGATVETVTGDVRDAQSCRDMVAACQEKLGGLDILFTNAGGPPSGPISELSDGQFQEALELNLLSVVHLCRAAVPVMRAQRSGRVIALTSFSVKQPVDGLVLSNTARAGAQGFLKSLANEVAADGITVNTVCPGYTGTERLGELAAAVAGRTGQSEDQVYASWAASTPAGRIGEPREVAALVAFLASARAGYLNGTVIPVDGGAVKGLL